MADKPKLKYRVVTGKNPRTSATILRPVITDRETYYIDQVIDFALNSGYIRGQFEDSKGTVNGFIEACKQLGLMGKAINLANWMRIHAELTGTVDETRQLTDANELNVNITALTDLKGKASDFSWTNVDDTGIVVRVDTIMSPNGTNGEIIKTKTIEVYGKNLQYSASLGDTVTLGWLEGTTAKTAAIVPTESDYGHMTFAWPEALAEVAAGTEIVISFRTRGGVEGGAEYPVTKTVKLVAAS